MDARRLERLLSFILAVGLWILADVAPTYHVKQAASVHSLYTALGVAAALWGLVLPQFGRRPRFFMRRLWKRSE